MTTPEGEGAQSGAEGTQSGAGDLTGTGTNPQTDPNGTQSGAVTPPADTSEIDKVRERMRQADSRAGKLEAELKQLRDKDLPEAEKLKRDYEESQSQVVKLQESNGRLAAEVAFLKDNTYTWHDPATALKLVDMSQVEIGDDGSATGMKDALKALATSHPFLVKQDVKEEPKPPAGTAPGNNGNNSGAPKSQKGMANRIPALRTRVPKG